MNNKLKHRYNYKCQFFVEYICDSYNKNHYYVHKFYEFHNHELNKKVTKDMRKYFNEKGRPKISISDAKFK